MLERMGNLVRKDAPFIEVRFIHSDGNEHYFYSVVNDLSGDRLSGFDHGAPTINESLASIRATVARIKHKALRVLSIDGNL